jgi:hypothetical protein
MTRLTYLPGCLLVAMNLVVGAAGASATGVVPGTQAQVQLQTSIVQGARLPPSKYDDDWFLKQMLSPQRLRHLKLGSDLQGLADTRVSQTDSSV